MRHIAPRARQLRQILDDMGMLTLAYGTKLDNIIKRREAATRADQKAVKLIEEKLRAEVRERRRHLVRYVAKLDSWERILDSADRSRSPSPTR